MNLNLLRICNYVEDLNEIKKELASYLFTRCSKLCDYEPNKMYHCEFSPEFDPCEKCYDEMESGRGFETCSSCLQCYCFEHEEEHKKKCLSSF